MNPISEEGRMEEIYENWKTKEFKEFLKKERVKANKLTDSQLKEKYMQHYIYTFTRNDIWDYQKLVLHPDIKIFDYDFVISKNDEIQKQFQICLFSSFLLHFLICFKARNLTLKYSYYPFYFYAMVTPFAIYHPMEFYFKRKLEKHLAGIGLYQKYNIISKYNPNF